MTNYEKIKSMSVDEMERFLLKVHCDGWVKGNNDDFGATFDRQWLESEAEPNVCTDKQNKLRYCEDCHDECKESFIFKR